MTFRKIAPNTYEVATDDRGPVGIVQRDAGASTWSAYDLAGNRVVDRYPGSRRVAAGNLIRFTRA
jgi:hypothetical protein